MIKKIAIVTLTITVWSISGKTIDQPVDYDFTQLVRSLHLLALNSDTTQKAPIPKTKSQVIVDLKQRDLQCVSLERMIHELINIERTKHGLKSLAWNDQLAQAALIHSNDMATRNYFEHFSPEGHDFLWRYKQVKFHGSVTIGNTSHLGAENIALDTIAMMETITTHGSRGHIVKIEKNLIPIPLEKVAQSIVNGWMESPGHRKNILTPHWGREGIGAATTTDQKTSNLVVYVTQNFC